MHVRLKRTHIRIRNVKHGCSVQEFHYNLFLIKLIVICALMQPEQNMTEIVGNVILS
jgi:hypothetical protein